MSSLSINTVLGYISQGIDILIGVGIVFFVLNYKKKQYWHNNDLDEKEFSIFEKSTSLINDFWNKAVIPGILVFFIFKSRVLPLYPSIALFLGMELIIVIICVIKYFTNSEEKKVINNYKLTLSENQNIDSLSAFKILFFKHKGGELVRFVTDSDNNILLNIKSNNYVTYIVKNSHGDEVASVNVDDFSDEKKYYIGMYDAEQFQIVAESDGPDAYNVIGRKYIIRKDISGKKYTICNIHGDEQAIIALNGGDKPENIKSMIKIVAKMDNVIEIILIAFCLVADKDKKK